MIFARVSRPGCPLSSCRQRSLATLRQKQSIRRAQQEPCRQARIRSQTSQPFEILHRSKQSYYVKRQDQKILQMTTIVKFADDFEMDILAGATALMLDTTGSTHSIYRKGMSTTGSYWDLASLLPGLVGPGPIGILGLGAGTVAHTMHHFWPQTCMVGWELDSQLLPAVREHMGLQELEDCGALECHVGDALGDEAVVEGGFAGLTVDLFAEGQVLPDLQQVETWQKLKHRLRPNGRIIVNVADSPAVAQAIHAVFPDVCFHAALEKATRNYVAMTGPAVEESTWQTFPAELAHCTSDWIPFEELDLAW